MQEKNMRYGQFLRAKRISDSRELTLKDIEEIRKREAEVEEARKEEARKAFEAKQIADKELQERKEKENEGFRIFCVLEFPVYQPFSFPYAYLFR